MRLLKRSTKNVIGLPEERREMVEQKHTLEGIMAGNLPALMKDTKLQIQQTPIRINEKKIIVIYRI